MYIRIKCSKYKLILKSSNEQLPNKVKCLLFESDTLSLSKLCIINRVDSGVTVQVYVISSILVHA